MTMRQLLLALAFVAGFGLTIGVTQYRVRDLGLWADVHGGRHHADARLWRLEARPESAALEHRVGQCEAKLADVRQVLEVLIRTEQSTGRRRWSLEALPRPVSDWPAWPCRGAAIGSITERSHPCGNVLRGRVKPTAVSDAEAAAIRAQLAPVGGAR